MTKQILSPTALLLAAGCTTQGATLDDYGLADIDAQAKDEGHPLPDHQDMIDALVDGIVDATASSQEQKSLLDRVYSLPVSGATANGPEEGMCGTTPEIDDIKVLDADCSGMNLRWGWEIDVVDCEVGDETFSGTMLITYDELQELPPFFPVDLVMLQAYTAVGSNADGNSSVRYDLRLESSDTALTSCGREMGAVEWRFDEQETQRFSFVDDSVEHSHNNGVQHQAAGQLPEIGAITLKNGDGVYEITLQDGDRSLVDYSVDNALTRDGDIWPHQGSISAHVERVGNVSLLFTNETPVDGSAQALTPFGAFPVTLPMD